VTLKSSDGNGKPVGWAGMALLLRRSNIQGWEDGRAKKGACPEADP